jgi:hypothetical protein
MGGHTKLEIQDVRAFYADCISKRFNFTIVDKIGEQGKVLEID